MANLEKPTDRVGVRKFIRNIRKKRHRYRQFVGIMFLIALTIVGLPRPQWFGIGVALALVGIVIRLWASGYVKKDKVLATTGPYAYVRHPLYVGNQLIAFGFCLASGLWWSFVAWLAIWFYFYPQTIRHEDDVLGRLFPDEWPAWSARVQALIPRLTPYKPGGSRGPWSFSQSLRQNGEPLIAALLALCLYLLYRRLL